MKAIIFLLLCILLLASCSRRIMEASETHKLHDEYFILRRNGHYSLKISMMGLILLPDSERGPYLLSNDTVYFVSKSQKNLYRTYGLGIIDSSARSFNFRIGDTAEWQSFRIHRLSWEEIEKRKKKQQRRSNSQRRS